MKIKRLLLITFKGEGREVKVVALGISVLQEGPPLLLLVERQRSLYQISDGVLRRQQHLYGAQAAFDGNVQQQLRRPKERVITALQRKLKRQRSGCKSTNGMFLRLEFTRRVLAGEFSPMTRWRWSHAYEDEYFRFSLFEFLDIVFFRDHMRPELLLLWWVWKAESEAQRERYGCKQVQVSTDKYERKKRPRFCELEKLLWNCASFNLLFQLFPRSDGGGLG